MILCDIWASSLQFIFWGRMSRLLKLFTIDANIVVCLVFFFIVGKLNQGEKTERK
jgi:hypothetical protein